MTPTTAFFTAGRPNAFAHRGDRSGHPPGNRASAFQSAIDLGFDHLESDVHLTADGEVVLFHDDVLDDDTDAHGPVSRASWTELERTRYVVSGTTQDEGPMRLSDALRRWPHVCWNLDAKHDEVVDPVIDVIDDAGAADRVLLTAFSWRRVRRLRRATAGRVATGHSRVELAVLRLLAWLRIPLPHRGDAVQLPPGWKGLRLVDARFVDACHRSSMPVHVFTLDEPERIERMLDLGVDAVMTDHPEQLRAVLERRGRW